MVTPGLVKSGNILEYLSRRFMRIMPLLVVVVVSTAFILGPILTDLPVLEYFSRPNTWLYLKNITTSLQLNLPGVTNHHGASGINNPLWTLRYEWICYFIVAIASIALALRNRLAFALAWVAVIIAYPILFGFTGVEEGSGQLKMLLLLFGFFGAGTLIALYSKKILWSRSLMILAAILLVLVFYFQIAQLFAPFLVSYLAVGIGLIKMPWSRFLERADLSYGMYLTHALVLTTLMHFYSFQNPLALFAVCMPIALIVAWLTWTIVEKPALEHKSLPALLVRSALQRLPLGPKLLRLLEPRPAY